MVYFGQFAERPDMSCTATLLVTIRRRDGSKENTISAHPAIAKEILQTLPKKTKALRKNQLEGCPECAVFDRRYQELIRNHLGRVEEYNAATQAWNGPAIKQTK